MEELIGSAAGGGLLGIFGSAINRVFSIWEAREERENMRVENAHELKLIAEQRQTNRAETEMELARLQTEGSYEGLSESLKHDSKFDNVDPWVNNVRALVRPSLTFASFVALSSMAYFMADLRVDLTEAVVFISTTSAAWWFGSRDQRNLPSVRL